MQLQQNLSGSTWPVPGFIWSREFLRRNSKITWNHAWNACDYPATSHSGWLWSILQEDSGCCYIGTPTIDHPFSMAMWVSPIDLSSSPSPFPARCSCRAVARNAWLHRSWTWWGWRKREEHGRNLWTTPDIISTAIIHIYIWLYMYIYIYYSTKYTYWHICLYNIW